MFGPASPPRASDTAQLARSLPGILVGHRFVPTEKRGALVESVDERLIAGLQPCATGTDAPGAIHQPLRELMWLREFIATAHGMNSDRISGPGPPGDYPALWLCTILAA